jgi:hypothetical protein
MAPNLAVATIGTFAPKVPSKTKIAHLPSGDLGSADASAISLATSAGMPIRHLDRAIAQTPEHLRTVCCL